MSTFGKGNERKFVFVIATYETYIDLNKIYIDINFQRYGYFHYWNQSMFDLEIAF